MAESAKTIGGYALEQKIRTGPHLAVFESHDKLGRAVEVACYRAGALRNRTGKEAFLAEARRTAALHHENLCLIVDAGEEEGIWYAISVAPDAPSLRELLDRGGPLDGDRMAVVAAGALAGLSYLAREELRHADLRPETVFLRGGRVVLAPRPLVPYAPRERNARYLSPEEIRAQGSDVRSDLFSLGLVLLEGLTGSAALTGDSPEASLEALRSRPPEPPPGTPPGLAALIRAVLAERPEDRPTDPGAGLRILHGEVAPAMPAPAGVPAAPATARAPAPFAGVAPATPVAQPLAPAAPRTPPGILTLPAGDKSALWELTAEPTHLGLAPDGSVRLAGPGAKGVLGRIERGDRGDVLVVDEAAVPRPRVNGSLVDRHPLVPGDRIRVGDHEIEYSPARPEPRKTVPVPRRTSGSPTLILLSVLLCVAVIGFGIFQGLRATSDGEDVLAAAGEAEARLAEAEGRPASAPGTGAGDREKARQLFDAAQQFAARNPADIAGIVKRYREVASFYGGTDFGWFAQQKLVEIDTAVKEGLAKEWDALGQEAGRRIEEDQLYDAHLLYLNFGRDHPDTLFADRAVREAENLHEAIRSRYADDLERVEEALRAREYGVALDILLAIERYGTPDQRREAAERKDEVRAKIQETQVPGEESPPEEPPAEGPPEPPPVEPPPVEPANGADDEKAGKLLERATTLYERKRYDEVLETLAELAALGETRVATERAAEIERMRGLSRIEVESFGALFQGSPQVIRGREVELAYRFDSPEEMKDWIYLNPFADVRPGSFFFTEEGIRGRGVGAALHPAVFEAGTLVMKARVKPIGEVKDLGFQMFEPEGLIRFYLFTVQNRFFTIGAGRAAAHENMIWIFGEGAWADTPNAELGFVRVAGSEDPKPISGEWFDLEAAKAGDRVSMTILRKKLTGSALGDDKFQYPALQPALYVLGSEAVFDEVVIRGTLDSKWAEDKMARLRRVFEK